jgi:hypothetical protein
MTTSFFASFRFGFPSFGAPLWLPFTLPLTIALGACQSVPPEAPIVAQTLVISRWEHRPNGDGAYGIDLDRRVSEGDSGCTEAADFMHVTDPRAGIDNQYAGLLLALLMSYGDPTPVTDRVSAELEAGRSLFGLEILPPAREGGPIAVTLLSFTSTGPLPRSVDDQAADGWLVATPIEAVAAQRTPLGLRVAFPSTISIPMGATLGEREVEEVQFELVLDEDGVVRRGDFGGLVTMETVMSVAEAVSPVAVRPSDLLALTQPDLRPDERGANCSAVSLGVGLSFARLPESTP